MNIWITLAISVALAFKFGLTVSSNARKTCGAYNGGKAFLGFFVGIVGANVLIAAVAKPVPILALVLAAIYTIFVIYMMMMIKMTKVTVLERDQWGEVVYDDGNKVYQTVPDHLATMRNVFSTFLLEVPAALSAVYAKAALKGSNFLNPWKTIKGFVWTFLVPLIVVAVFGLFRYLWISGFLARLLGLFKTAEETDSDDEEDDDSDSNDEDEYDDEDDDSYSDEEYDDEDEYDDRPSRGGWLKQNWLALASIILVLGALIICVTIVLKTISS